MPQITLLPAMDARNFSFNYRNVFLVAVVAGILCYHPIRNWSPLSVGMLNGAPDLTGIPRLIQDSGVHFENMLGSQTFSCDAAVEAYKARRGRDPPLAFEEWLRLAKQYNAVMIEQFYDSIEDDLTQFRDLYDYKGMEALLRYTVHNSNRLGLDVLRIRNHTTDMTCTDEFCQHFANMLNEVSLDGAILPNIDLPINFEVGPKVLVSWNATRPGNFAYERASPVSYRDIVANNGMVVIFNVPTNRKIPGTKHN
jgi:hypothetical protein